MASRVYFRIALTRAQFSGFLMTLEFLGFKRRCSADTLCQSSILMVPRTTNARRNRVSVEGSLRKKLMGVKEITSHVAGKKCNKFGGGQFIDIELVEFVCP